MERTNAKSMNPSVKKWIHWMRMIQLVLRCLEIPAAVGILVMAILITGVNTATGWIMRITVSLYSLPQCLADHQLTYFSLLSPSFIPSTEFITWDESHLEGPQHLRHPICCSPHSSMPLSFHSMLSALWQQRLAQMDGRHYCRIRI